MSHSLSSEHQVELIGALLDAVSTRAASEQRIHDAHHKTIETLNHDYGAARDQAVEQFATDKANLKNSHAEENRRIEREFSDAHDPAKKEYDRVCAANQEEFEKRQRIAAAKRNEMRWEATTVFDATKNDPKRRLNATNKKIETINTALVSIQQDAELDLVRLRQWRNYEDPEPTSGVSEIEQPLARLLEIPDQAEERQFAMSASRAARFFVGLRPLGLLLLLFAVLAYPSFVLIGDWFDWRWAAISAAAAALLSGATSFVLYPVARRKVSQSYGDFRQLLIDADRIVVCVKSLAALDCKNKSQQIVQQRDDELQLAEQEFTQKSAVDQQQFEQASRAAEEKFPPLITSALKHRDAEHEKAQLEFKHRQQDLDRSQERQLDQLLLDHGDAVAKTERCQKEEFDKMAAEWTRALACFQEGVHQIDEDGEQTFHDWFIKNEEQWRANAEVPPAIRFGQYEINLKQIRKGISVDPRLQAAQTEFSMPALVPRDRHMSLLLEATGGGLDQAVQTLQAVMLRLLLSMPLGKVRFTIIDPLGLGKNFSAFMHLADYDKALINSRIWTESGQIESRLADLTEHMENVIQKYLRNEFETIEQYNQSAGEVAEPYHFLVVANFPANFSENAARRLLSIASTGSRCGVFTLMSVDSKKTLPHHFDIKELRKYAEVLLWKNKQFVWQQPDLGKLPLVLDVPPGTEQFTKLVRLVGEQSKDARRVEVPFDVIAPAEDEVWQSDASRLVQIPLGRAGAKHLQSLSLGKGTSQHVLIAGKTGSGKSTLLHAIVTNIALRYSPKEIEFYLIDFKKGVEFKAYATFQLPHARVIAIESEREFGLSVLRRLNEELKRRGDLYRSSGAQDLAAYRAANSGETMPRILLIIDEFQEFFVEEDKLAQESSLLLDRLVRQGRAFGIHVLLGSQTLGGAYSLARTTLGQMAIRIAMQCSEADAHMILSEENTAARLLSRPGEAIYNDANGLVEGNHPFQVSWLPDDERERYLLQIRKRAEQDPQEFEPPLIFEGNVPANIEDNPLFMASLAAPSWSEKNHNSRIWLGAAVEIKDPTSVTLRRQSGDNLLCVGGDSDAVSGLITTTLLSLATQHVPDTTSTGPVGCRIFVLDGMPVDSPDADLFKTLKTAIPHQMYISRSRKLAETIGLVCNELDRRIAVEEESAPCWFLLVRDLGRLRDLRREDDFSMSGFGEEPKASPAKQLGHLLREGPAFGVHVILWCDNSNNVNRSLDRTALREIENRIVFQMNSTDSSTLIDTPAASRLGPNRAIVYNEENAEVEKFRPYGMPSSDQLSAVGSDLTVAAKEIQDSEKTS